MRNSFETQPVLFVSSTKLYHPSLDGLDDSWQPHIVSHWLREKQAFTLEEAARLTTYYTATHLVIP